jgi:transcriptional regulator with XRE-family HTH domain
MVKTSGDIIGRYERDEVTPSVEVASKLADALDVSLDYLSGKTDTELDSATLGRIREISVMPEEDKKQVKRKEPGGISSSCTKNLILLICPIFSGHTSHYIDYSFSCLKTKY